MDVLMNAMFARRRRDRIVPVIVNAAPPHVQRLERDSSPQ
jgi:hypothetical protein